jgi:type I restriction-modification system DNA methylase subunit
VQLRAAFKGENDKLLFSELATLANDQILPALNQKFFPFYAHILSEARKVWEGNLSDKVQDQLVLIEEVFSNSNFSNNVTSGNMGEIIGLVAELDKDRLLKTDLLGDAIESALSETGGTKDIGLHRTPDHIRQFMVGLAMPTFGDQIFDPTVGTGGFMFDSFEYVMQGVSRDGHWPGPKSHPELAAWFKDWFAKHPVPMPSIETTTDFYRTGVGGIEYLGMVRKMAAINFYVRGLNPGNIQQGDSLEKFGTEILPNSKTVILANPPFGAERDKESYPNVWSEYPTESETTILFVKLMLESLKPGGRCAVIVSEGFLTWDQNSARALRRALLDECDLQAVISLPQGLFVSKGGQGPKTSILYFVKGGRTRNVWFYKVTNDGYTMGTNRKPVPGCQLVEALKLFHRYVREGKQPPETRHSFCIPADWIKVLDPRVKDKIRDETRAEMSTRAAEDKTKLAEKLDAQVAAKKLTATERKDRLAQHDELWLSKTENAIAQKIERAHLYSFNLPNYRSSLTPAQLAAWKDFAATYVREDGPSKTLEKQYRAIATATPDALDELISGLDPRHTLELDIARQFLTDISDKLFKKHPHLRTLQEIIASQQKLPRVSLKGLLRLNTDTVAPSDFPDTRFRVLGVNNETGVFLNETLPGSEINQRNYRVKPGEFCYNPYRINVGSIGLNEFDYDNQIISGAYVVFGTDERELHPKLLGALFKSPQFLAYVNEKASGGVRMNFRFEHLEDWEIPLLLPEEQERFCADLETPQRSIRGIGLVLDSWTLKLPPIDGEAMLIGDLISDGKLSIGSGDSLSKEVQRAGPYPVYGGNGVQGYHDTFNHEPGVISIGRVGALCGCVHHVGERCWVTDNSFALVVRDRQLIDPRYLAAVLSVANLNQFKNLGAQPNINQQTVKQRRITIPLLTQQERIVADIDAKMKLLNELRSLKGEAERSIQQALNRIWES